MRWPSKRSMQQLSRRIVTAAVGVVLIGACDDDPTGPEFSALRSAEAQWRAVQPATNSYIVQQQIVCFCRDGSTTYEVTVTAGTVSYVRALADSVPVPVDQFARFQTIDHLFEQVRAALKTSGQLVAVEYDAAFGYPTVVSLDPIKNAVDDEVTYRTHNYTGIP